MDSKKEQYIQDGLVLWLDGIDKGATDGTWVDLIGGKVFTANNESAYIEPVNNGFQFNKPGSGILNVMQNSTGKVGNNTWTIEAACTCIGTAQNYATLFMASSRACGVSLHGDYFFTSNNPAWVVNNNRTGVIILSVDTNTGMENGIELTTKSGGLGQMTTSGCRVGSCQSAGQNFYGVIHSIRMYNRSLSLEEKLHNQRIDNIRFNLGLEI